MAVSYSDLTKQLIDALKGICTSNGLGNDGNEFKIITQVFLYKYLNDKFLYEIKEYAKEYDEKLAKAINMEKALMGYSEKNYRMLLMGLSPSAARLKREHFLSQLAQRMNEGDFHKTFDETLLDIGKFNEDIFSISTDGGAKVVLFDEISQYITDPGKRDDFCRAMINRLTEFSFEHIFDKGYDFFATIFEYLIKDYNKDSGGKYAEYYTPHSVAKIMSAILVNSKVSNVKVYDPSAGSGTLLMSIAHAIGDEKCTIYRETPE
jgi:type I restriction enzyme M protein